MHKEVKIGIVIGVLLMSLIAIFLMARPGTQTRGDEYETGGVEEALGPPGEPGPPVGFSGQLPGPWGPPDDVTPSGTATRDAGATEGAGAGTGVATPPTTVRKHKVVEGDTLTSIARKYYSSVKKADINRIHNANRQVIRDPNVLVVGTELVIPEVSAAPSLPAAIRPRVRVAGRGATHIVRTGDTLTRLARKYYNSEKKADIDRIFNANRSLIRHRDVLVVGTRLVIPPKP